MIERTEPLRGGDPRVGLLPGMCSAGRGIYIHQTAVVEDVLDLGNDCLVWGMAYVMRGAYIGPHCMLGQSVHVGTEARIGSHCSIQNGAQIFTGVTLEDGVFIGPHVSFTNVTVPRAFTKAVKLETTLVKLGASIGANATIVCGVEIGEFAMIGAGSVVTKNVNPHMLMAGNPAKQLGWVCRCGKRIFPPSRYVHEAETEITAPCSGCGRKITVVYTRLHPYNAIEVKVTDAT